MARKLRVEYPGAIYHVLNRGNYRRDVFVSAGEAQAFVTALEEATLTFGWKVYAYAIMRNHYHLAIETPQPNLKAGMHWLQSTYATRFNRLHRERGHLFQGRYHSLLVAHRRGSGRVLLFFEIGEGSERGNVGEWRAS
jgi:putative transposase